MKRLLLCVLIFLSVAAGATLSLTTLRGSTDELIGVIDELEQIHDSGSRSEALEKLTDIWEDYYSKSSFITRSEQLDDMSVSIEKLRNLVGAELTTELVSLKERARMIYEEQIPRISGIL